MTGNPPHVLLPHQVRGIEEIERLIEAGERRLCLQSPTGGGKTLMMCSLIEQRDEPVVLYTNRRMLLEQTANRLQQHGIDFGLRASGHTPHLASPVQLAMIQTEDSLVFKKKRRELHYARLVLIDEAHVNAAGTAQRIIERHLEDGAAVVGFTATPLGLGHMYDTLVEAGTPSELRGYGLLVPAKVYAPDEPDWRKLKQSEKTGEFTEASVRKAIMSPVIFGRVFDHWKAYNPDARPTILFAPGVAESIWFCEQFAKRGVRAAHIDGKQIWLDGEFLPADQENRDYIAALSKRGDLPLVSNRFVLREGIDWPWLYHGILATAFGSLVSYIQSVGRLLRAYPGMENVVVTDHGGAWHRHGSPNADREWDLDKTPYREANERWDRMRQQKEPEPIHCPQCHAIRLSGPVCLECGYEHHTRSRMVIETNGRLREVNGRIYKDRKRVESTPAIVRDWEKMYWRSYKKGRTFRAAEALFAKEHKWKWPPRDLPLMPRYQSDWYASVEDVPFERLHLTERQREKYLRT